MTEQRPSRIVVSPARGTERRIFLACEGARCSHPRWPPFTRLAQGIPPPPGPPPLFYDQIFAAAARVERELAVGAAGDEAAGDGNGWRIAPGRAGRRRTSRVGRAAWRT